MDRRYFIVRNTPRERRGIESEEEREQKLGEKWGGREIKHDSALYIYIRIKLWSAAGTKSKIEIVLVCRPSIDPSYSYSTGLPPKQKLSVPPVVLRAIYRFYFSEMLMKTVSTIASSKTLRGYDKAYAFSYFSLRQTTAAK